MKSLESLGALVTSLPFISVIVASRAFNPIMGTTLPAFVVAGLLVANDNVEANNAKTSEITNKQRETRLRSRT